MAPEAVALENRAALLNAPSVVPLTTDEVALATGLAVQTLRQWASVQAVGKLLPFTKRGGRNLYRPADVRSWLGIEVGE